MWYVEQERVQSKLHKDEGIGWHKRGSSKQGELWAWMAILSNIQRTEDFEKKIGRQEGCHA